jgi:glycerol-3-phosphate acyltransferase PlsY
MMSVLLVWRHEGNIRKLLAGTESKLFEKKSHHKPPAAAAPHGHKKGHHG